MKTITKLMNEGGRIVTVCSKHYQNSNNKKEMQFREWLDSVHADVTEIPHGTFKESGTMISAVIIIIDKPYYENR